MINKQQQKKCEKWYLTFTSCYQKSKSYYLILQLNKRGRWYLTIKRATKNTRFNTNNTNQITKCR